MPVHTQVQMHLQAPKKWVISKDEKGLLEGLIASDEKPEKQKA